MMLARLFRSTTRAFHTLVALAFLGLSGLGVGVSFSEWRTYQRAPSMGLAEFALVAGFTVLLIIFCLYSFAKARSVR